MRLSKSSELYNASGQPKYWSARADDLWRATAELPVAASEPNDAPVHMDEGVAVFTIDGPIYNVSPRASKFFEKIDPHQAVRFDINSPGGLVDEGVAIRAMMLRHKGTVTAQVLGVAASAAHFLTLGADTIKMSDASMLMAHRPWSGAVIVGDWEQMKAESDALVKMMKQFTHTFEKVIAQRMKIPQSRVAEMLKAETWYTPEEAVEARLADSIYPVVESDEQPGEESPEDETQTDMPFQLSVEQLVKAIAPAL